MIQGELSNQTSRVKVCLAAGSTIGFCERGRPVKTCMNPMIAWSKEKYRTQFRYWLSMVFSAHVRRGEFM
jgi:hypothetical protein